MKKDKKKVRKEGTKSEGSKKKIKEMNDGKKKKRKGWKE
jgi:hypothetical protein